MRVMMTIAEMRSGGAETLVEGLATATAAAGHRVSVVSSGGWRAERLAAVAAVDTVRVPLRRPGRVALLAAALRIALHARRRRIDVAHTHNVRATVATRLGLLLAARRVPIVATVHGLAPEDYARAARLLARTAVAVVAVSTSVRDDLVAAGLDPGRIRVIGNAVAPAQPQPRDQARARLGLAADVPVAVCVARLAEPKRHDLLLEAWAGLPDGVLLVVGDGPRRVELERQAARLLAEGRVRFLGTRDDIGALLSAADVAVLASDREGLPMAVLEAMAAGVPVVASGVGGLLELEGAILTVAPDSAASLAAGLTVVLGDAERAAALARTGLETIRSRFGHEDMCESYLRLFRDPGLPAPTAGTLTPGDVSATADARPDLQSAPSRPRSAPLGGWAAEEDLHSASTTGQRHRPAGESTEHGTT